MPKYSIITPLYNSFNLMKRYFISLENQTYKDFEVLIIDDCSIDDSFDKTLDYAKKSKLNIQLFKTDTNAGPGNARNIGLLNAKGEWVTFIDNDDWVTEDFLEKIENIINNNKVNCVIFDYYIVNQNNHKKVFRSMYKGDNGVIPLSDSVIYTRNHTVGKFYKLSECKKNNILFPELRRCEDVAFVARALVACKTIYYFKEPLYYYFQRSNSLSNNTKLDEADMIKAFSILENELSKNYPNEIKEKSVTDLLYGSVLVMCKANKSNKAILDYIINYEKKYSNWWICKIKKYIGKPKLIFLVLIRFKLIFLLKLMAKIHGILLKAL